MKLKMEGKNCVVTGANAGIGFAVAESLASRGANVYMVCRNKERGDAALSEIRSKSENQNVFLEICDLSSVNDTKALASRINVPVHVLVNNAGVLENQKMITSEGFETNFAVNVMGTFTLTELLMPSLKKASPEGRVITVSSGGQYSTSLTDDLQYSKGEFNGVEQYARNKRLQVALTEKWAEIYKDEGVGFYAMHPGWAHTPGVVKSLPSFNEKLAGKLRTKEEGADTIVWLALQPNHSLKSGGFYFDRVEAPKDLFLTGTMPFHANIEQIYKNLKSLASPP